MVIDMYIKYEYQADLYFMLDPYSNPLFPKVLYFYVDMYMEKERKYVVKVFDSDDSLIMQFLVDSIGEAVSIREEFFQDNVVKVSSFVKEN